MFNSQFFADSEFLHNLIQWCSLLCSEHPEYFNFIVVSAMIFLMVCFSNAILLRLQALGQFFSKFFVFIVEFFIVTMKRVNRIRRDKPSNKPLDNKGNGAANDQECNCIHNCFWIKWSPYVVLECVSVFGVLPRKLVPH